MLYSKTFFAKAPFIRLVLAFALGIVVQHYAGFPVIFLLSGTGFLCLLSCLLFFLKKEYLYPFVLLCFLVFGSLHNSFFYTENLSSEKLPTEETFRFEVLKTLKKDSLRQKFLGDVSWKLNDSTFGTQAIATLNSNEDAQTGDRIIAKGYWNQNPDLVKYYGTGNTVFIPEENFLVQKNQSLPSKAKRTLLAFLKKHIHKKDTRAFLSALLLGEKSGIPKNLKADFINTGAAHLLAISGLHVGMIFGILYALLFPFFRIKKLYPLGAVLLISSLIFYGFICNWSISILRSVIMIAVFLIGNTLNRKTNSFNLLAFSAFLVLIISPEDLFSVGFQLSYGAVLSIFLFYPILKNLYYPNNKIIRYVLDLAYISIAVQFITAPISIYHFGVFPVYFLPANMVAVPMVFLIMITAIVNILLGNTIPFLFNVLEFLCRFLFQFLSEISQWSFSVAEIHFSLITLCLLIACILSFYLYYTHRNIKNLNLMLLAILVFTGVFLFQPEAKHPVSLNAFYKDSIQLRFKNTQTDIQTISTGQYVSAYNILVLDSLPQVYPERKIEIDKLVVSSKTKNLFWVQAVFDFEQLIVTDYLPFSLKDAIPTEKIYFLKKEGALALE